MLAACWGGARGRVLSWGMGHVRGLEGRVGRRFRRGGCCGVRLGLEEGGIVNGGVPGELWWGGICDFYTPCLRTRSSLNSGINDSGFEAKSPIMKVEELESGM